MAVNTIDYDRMLEILNALGANDRTVLDTLTEEEQAFAAELNSGMLDLESDTLPHGSANL